MNIKYIYIIFVSFIFLNELNEEKTDIEKKSILNSILVNSAMALHLVDAKKSYEDCFNEAKENIFNGNALNKLNQLREITNK